MLRTSRSRPPVPHPIRRRLPVHFENFSVGTRPHWYTGRIGFPSNIAIRHAKATLVKVLDDVRNALQPGSAHRIAVHAFA